MPRKDLIRSQKASLSREVWTEEWVERLEKCIHDGDQLGADRIKFSRYLKGMRLACNLTQDEAGERLRKQKLNEARKRPWKGRTAKCAQENEPRNRRRTLNPERQQWNSWEKARYLPTDRSIRRIATVLDGDAAAFLRRAGRSVPSALLVYDEEWAARTFRRKLRDAQSFVQLVDAVQAIWQKSLLEQTGAKPHIKIDRAYSQVLEMVYLYLDERQQVQLAQYIIARRNDFELKKHVDDVLSLRNAVQKRFEDLTAVRLPILDEVVTEALEDLDVLAGRFDGVTNEMQTLLDTLSLRNEKPIAEPHVFIHDLMKSFEVAGKFEPVLTSITNSMTEIIGNINTSLNKVSTKQAQTLEVLFQLCESTAKLERRVATIMDEPQKIFGEIEESLQSL